MSKIPIFFIYRNFRCDMQPCLWPSYLIRAAFPLVLKLSCLESGSKRRSQHRYQIVAAEAMEGLAKRLEERYPDRFRFHKTSWGKFPDGTDNIEVC